VLTNPQKQDQKLYQELDKYGKPSSSELIRKFDPKHIILKVVNLPLKIFHRYNPLQTFCNFWNGHRVPFNSHLYQLEIVNIWFVRTSCGKLKEHNLFNCIPIHSDRWFRSLKKWTSTRNMIR
jgi:hypothetical protein